MIRQQSWIVLIVIICTSCERKKEATNDAVTELAKSIKNGILTSDRRQLLDKFDLDEFESKCLREVSNNQVDGELNMLSRDHRLRVIEGIRMFFDELIQYVNNGGYIGLSRHYQHEGSEHLVFSVYTAIGVKFIDIQMSQSTPGKFTDYYDYYLGEDFSSSYASYLLNLLVYSTDLESNFYQAYYYKLESLVMLGRLLQSEEVLQEISVIFDLTQSEMNGLRNKINSLTRKPT